VQDLTAFMQRHRYVPANYAGTLRLPPAGARRSLERRIQDAHIGRFKSVCDFDWSWPKRCDRATFEALMSLDFLKDAANAVLVGPNECDSYCSSLDLLKDPTLSDADCQTTDAEVGGPELLG
jgi:hypothetical protein